MSNLFTPSDPTPPAPPAGYIPSRKPHHQVSYASKFFAALGTFVVITGQAIADGKITQAEWDMIIPAAVGAAIVYIVRNDPA